MHHTNKLVTSTSSLYDRNYGCNNQLLVTNNAMKLGSYNTRSKIHTLRKTTDINVIGITFAQVTTVATLLNKNSSLQILKVPQVN